MSIFGDAIEIPGHDVTLRLLEEILADYQRACYATGRRVEQPHLKDTASKAIQRLSRFYTKRDADRLLDRAVAKRSPTGKP